MNRLDNLTVAVLQIRGNNQSSFRVEKLTDAELDDSVATAERIMDAVDRAWPPTRGADHDGNYDHEADHEAEDDREDAATAASGTAPAPGPPGTPETS